MWYFCSYHKTFCPVFIFIFFLCMKTNCGGRVSSPAHVSVLSLRCSLISTWPGGLRWRDTDTSLCDSMSSSAAVSHNTCGCLSVLNLQCWEACFGDVIIAYRLQVILLKVFIISITVWKLLITFKHVKQARSLSEILHHFN